LEVLDHFVEARPGHQSGGVGAIEQPTDPFGADVLACRRRIERSFGPDRSESGLGHDAPNHDDIVGPEVTKAVHGGK
jgi:hypothetical protein